MLMSGVLLLQLKHELTKEQDGPTYDVFARVLRGLSNSKLAKPGKFRSADGLGYALRCSYKVQTHPPAHHQPHVHVQARALQQVHMLLWHCLLLPCVKLIRMVQPPSTRSGLACQARLPVTCLLR